MNPVVLDAGEISRWIAQLMWPLFRVLAVLAFLPGIGGGEVPVRVRVALGTLITLLILPTIDTVPAIDPLSLDGVLVTLQQILIGLGMGVIVLVVFNAVTLAGESIAVTMGLGFALMNDPQNGVQVPTVSQFYLILATLLFLALDGHHAVLQLLAESFTLMPVGEPLGSDALWHLVSWGGATFTGALGIALPALTAMLGVNIALGVMTRAAPQLNLFSVGFPITMTIGFFAILFTLPVFRARFGFLFEASRDALMRWVGG